jgi:hypothetical protein
MAAGNVLTEGGGDRGAFLEIGCVPDSTFETELDALKAAGTSIVGKLVSLSWAAGYEVTSPADGAIPDGKIIQAREMGSTWKLTVRLFSYIDQNSSRHTPVGIINLPTNGGTAALQDSVIIYGSDYVYVDDGGTGGWGAVIATDVPGSNYVDVLF